MVGKVASAGILYCCFCGCGGGHQFYQFDSWYCSSWLDCYLTVVNALRTATALIIVATALITEALATKALEDPPFLQMLKSPPLWIPHFNSCSELHRTHCFPLDLGIFPLPGVVEMSTPTIYDN